MSLQAAKLKDGEFFTEFGPMWPGQGLSLKVKSVLYEEKSDFQVGEWHRHLCQTATYLADFSAAARLPRSAQF